MKAEDAEEYTQALGQIAAGWWRQRALGVRFGVPEALELSIEQWSERLGGYVRLAIPERREAVAELAADGFTQQETAAILGVSQPTISRDLTPIQDEYEDRIEPPAELQQDDPPAATVMQDEYEDRHEEVALPAGQEFADAVMAEIDAAVSAVITTQDEQAPLVPAERGWHKLGDHMLYCGDSTDEEFIAACQGALAFADPPYNAGKAEWDEGFEWRHDYLAEAADIVAVTPGIAALAGFLANTQMPYRWSMAAEITNGMTSGALRFGNWICVTLFAHGSIYRKSKDHVRIPAATGDDAGGSHPSRKPLRLMTHLIELFTTKGDTVIDPFLGSGTTLIAAERTGRRCIGAEIDPLHCAEIIARYGAAARPL